jgi:hypothetical protein
MSEGKLLFYFCGKPIYEGSQEKEDLDIFMKDQRKREISKQRSERLKQMHVDGTINAKYFKSKNEDDNLSAVSMFSHYFTKMNGATLEDSKGGYDLLKCSDCGLKGKRYGVSDMVMCGGDNINNCI